MSNSIAFLPWVSAREISTVGSLRLIPYKRNTLPGNSSHVSQRDIDEVLSEYANRKGVLVECCCLVEIDEWTLGQAADERIRKNLFKARELIAFSALAERRLFRNQNYCNFDTYALVMQDYRGEKLDHFRLQPST